MSYRLVFLLLVLLVSRPTTALVGFPDVLQFSGTSATLPADAGGDFTDDNLQTPSIHSSARTPDTLTTSTVISVDLGEKYADYPIRTIALLGGNWTSRATIRASGSTATFAARVRVAPSFVALAGASGSETDIDEVFEDSPDGNVITVPGASGFVVQFNEPGTAPPGGADRNLLRVLARCADTATLTLSVGGLSNVVNASWPLTDTYAEYVVAFDADDLSGTKPVLTVSAVVEGGANVEVEAVEWTYDTDPVSGVASAWKRAAALESGPGGISVDLINGQLSSTAVIALAAHQTAYRYWQIEIRDGANPDGYIQIGRLWMSPAVDDALLVGDLRMDLEQFGGEIAVSTGGVTWIDPPRVVRRRMSLSLRSSATVALREMMGAGGMTGAFNSPFLVVIHPDELPDDQIALGFLAVSDGTSFLGIKATKRGLPGEYTVPIVEVT